MTKLTSLIEEQIRQVAPNAKDIIVKVERNHGQYLSKVHMRLPGTVIHAQKKGQNIWEALILSYEATIKQIGKYKMKKRTKRKHMIWRWQDPLGPPP